MCGIAGILDLSRSLRSAELNDTIARMTETLVHRGPDDGDTWSEVESGVALGHRRLAILDLTPDSRQPMQSATGRFMIVFNGEIYNFQSLRAELSELGHSFRGTSDTEVMLASFEQWGVETAVQRFVGMFAFAAWDRRDKILHLSRDRMGEKPLYYGRCGELLLFGSELKAMRACARWKAQIDRGAVGLFLEYGYVPAPYSIYQHVCKLPPGMILSVHAQRRSVEHELATPTPYWSLKETAERGAMAPFAGDRALAVQELEARLRTAIQGQMVADVPLGAFLSGGIDSSTIVALMQQMSSQRVKTFTIGFAESGYDEAPYARAVANHLGTDHTELYVTHQDALQVVPRLASLYDEPLSDSSQIPTFLVSQLARSQVTVALSGDGGDELFAGYNRYPRGLRLLATLRWLPPAGRKLLGTALGNARNGRWRKLSELLTAPTPDALYERMLGTGEPLLACPGAGRLATVMRDKRLWANLPDFVSQMQYLDAMCYLPDDILAKVDRAGMGVSLETRIPLLDARIVEFAWRLPLSMKLHQGCTKWILRQVLYRHVPRALIERKKMGFSVPVGPWLRGPLREWAAELLREHHVRDAGLVDAKQVGRIWNEHQTGQQNWQHTLWRLITLHAWMESQKSCPGQTLHSARRAA